MSLWLLSRLESSEGESTADLFYPTFHGFHKQSILTIDDVFITVILTREVLFMRCSVWMISQTSSSTFVVVVSETRGHQECYGHRHFEGSLCLFSVL